jgi:protease I
MSKLHGKVIVTLVAEGVEDLEYYVPLMRLQEEGARVLSAGLDLKPVRGKNGLIISPDTTLDTLNANELFGIIVPGGWAPDKLRRYPIVTGLVRAMN